MERQLIDPEKLSQMLKIKDLTDPKNGIHAINLVIEKISKYFSNDKGWPLPEIRKSDPISTVANEFDRLYFPPDSPNRSAIYTRYITKDEVLRTHTSSMIPDILKELKEKDLVDYLVLCPGICYRRDVVDRKHVGEPHQIDIWRVKKGEPRLERKALIELIEALVDCLTPESKYRANEVIHPYTINGLEVEIEVDNNWMEILECGEIHPSLLEDAGLSPKEYSGLAMGAGLDRLVMIIKNIDDIRLLRSTDTRIQEQMINLDPYTSVSKYPPIRQDLSIAISKDTCLEDICEIIINILGVEANIVEEVTILSSTDYTKLPEQAIERLGIKPDQKNLLVRVILRSHERSLRHDEANEIRDKMYKALHQGDKGYV